MKITNTYPQPDISLRFGFSIQSKTNKSLLSKSLFSTNMGDFLSRRLTLVLELVIVAKTRSKNQHIGESGSSSMENQLKTLLEQQL